MTTFTLTSAESGSSAPTHSSATGSGWSDRIDDLLRVRNLADDWDGDGAVAPEAAVVDGAITLAQYLAALGTPPADRVHAGVNGTVYFEWHGVEGYREIEVTHPGAAECRWVPVDGTQAIAMTLNRQG